MSYLQTILGDTYTDGMTAEEIEAALETAGVDTPPPASNTDQEIEKLKRQLSKSNSENAEWKKKLREKQTEEERKAAEDAEKWEELQRNYDELRRDKTLSDHKAQLLGLGYTNELAAETAQAMIDGDSAKVFANQQKAFELKEQALRAELLKNAPRPGVEGSGEKVDDFTKMSITEKMTLKTQDPQRYKELSGNQ